MIHRTVLLFFLIIHGLVVAQDDCLLGVGGKDDKTIIEAFQLNDDQIEQMRNWAAELNYRNELLQDQANALLKKHSQSSPEDLLAMSYQYQTLVDSMRSNVRMIDKRLLELFNDKQYNRYVNLCNKATLSPIFANREQVNEK